jgi:cytoskeletal protein CcmA (bactofilin family)
MENMSEMDNQGAASNHLEKMSGSGELSIEGDLFISGTFKGKLNVSQSLIVGKEGIIIGEFRVRNLQVYGKVVGKIFVSNLAELHENSTISGRIVTKELKMHDQSKINGGRIIEYPTGEEAVIDLVQTMPADVPKNDFKSEKEKVNLK